MNKISKNDRARRFRNDLKNKKVIRLLEAHNGLTGVIVERAKVVKGKTEIEYDGIWQGSLTDSISRGKPDISVVDISSRIYSIHEILDVTTKPIIVDANNGGPVEHFAFTVRTLERIGVAAVVIEDKVGAKINSLVDFDSPKQSQDSIENFSNKIKIGKKSKLTKDFMIIARIESFPLGKSLDDAILRAKSYIKAGADGIVIHSKEKKPDQILSFCKEYKTLNTKIPLAVIPTTYNEISEEKLINAGAKIIIYANHLLRTAYPVMVRVAELILKNGRTFEIEKDCVPMKDILNSVPFSDIN